MRRPIPISTLDTCAVCGLPIQTGRYGDFTAAGRCTRTYIAWGHLATSVGTALDQRGADKPRSHWAHPAGADPVGEVSQ